MPRHAAVFLLAAAALAASSCDDVSTRLAINQPTSFQKTQTGFGITPSSVIAQPVDLFRCPVIPPFNVRVNLVVRAGDLDLFLTQIRLLFTDTTGVQMPQVTLPAPVMTTQFGSALVQARSARTFPLDFGVGCVTRRTGTLVIIVDTRDKSGRKDSGEVSVSVR